jgi:hypothetical protein
LAWSTGRIVLTEVKGFGEWVFAHNVTDISVLLLRYHHKEQDHIILKLLKIFERDERDENQLKGFFTTISFNRIRRRKL